MAAQSQKGGGSWGRWMSQPAFRLGWADFRGGQPFDEKPHLKLGVTQARIDFNREHGVDIVGQMQRMYESGRLMAAEASGKALPATAKRQTKEMMSVVEACPAMCQLFSTEQALARIEAKRAAALRLRLMAADRMKKEAARP